MFEELKPRIEIVAQWVKLPVEGFFASECQLEPPAALPYIQLTANGPGKAAEDSPISWAPALHQGDQDGVPCPCLGLCHPGSPLLVVESGGRYLILLSLPLKYISQSNK